MLWKQFVVAANRGLSIRRTALHLRFAPDSITVQRATTSKCQSRRGFSNSWSALQTEHGTKDVKNGQHNKLQGILDGLIGTAVSAIATGLVIAVGGYGYYRYYKNLEFRKMEAAFAPGDPALEMVEDDKAHHHDDEWILRKEQDRIDRIVSGEDVGHYFLLVGEKGTGKTSMLLKAMQKVSGEGIASFEAHADPEVFRVRLGKALNFEFKEDYIGGLFSIRGPRDATALLDIERAFNKLEKVALKRRQCKKGPLLLIINGLHLLRDDDEGRDILELMQQRAEGWAAAKLVTMVLNSDDYWVYERLKQYATRMQVIPVFDLSKQKAIDVLRRMRARITDQPAPSQSLLEEIYYHIGGRLSFLGQVAKEATNDDMLQKAKELRNVEKAWLLSQCWILGTEMDDDVMDEQKYSCAAWVLAKALVDKTKTMSTYDSEHGHHLPQIPLHEARQIMTRADFVKSYDHINIFTIDSHANVRADSVPMMHAFREICEQEGFEEHLQNTIVRIAAIESLGRTRELLLKGLSDGEKPEFKIEQRDGKGRIEKIFILKQ